MSLNTPIVHVAARPGLEPAAGMVTCAVSKAALVYLTRVLDLELRPLGIRVNAVAPALIDNARNRLYLPPDLLAHAVAPGAIADIIVHLVSDAAAPVGVRSCPPTEPDRLPPPTYALKRRPCHPPQGPQFSSRALPSRSVKYARSEVSTCRCRKGRCSVFSAERRWQNDRRPDRAAVRLCLRRRDPGQHLAATSTS